MLWFNPVTDDGMQIIPGSNEANVANNNIIITDQTSYGKNHGHSTLSTNPTLWIHSATDADSDDTQWISFAHDATDGVIDVGKGALLVDALLKNGTHTETIADDAGGTHASATLTPTDNFILCDCDDAHGCTITMGETGMASGMRVTIVGETATHCDFADTDGVSNLTGAFQMDDDDTLELMYSVDEWVEVSRSDN
jgi:hypothetical protein